MFDPRRHPRNEKGEFRDTDTPATPTVGDGGGASTREARELGMQLQELGFQSSGAAGVYEAELSDADAADALDTLEADNPGWMFEVEPGDLDLEQWEADWARQDAQPASQSKPKPAEQPAPEPAPEPEPAPQPKRKHANKKTRDPQPRDTPTPADSRTLAAKRDEFDRYADYRAWMDGVHHEWAVQDALDAQAQGRPLYPDGTNHVPDTLTPSLDRFKTLTDEQRDPARMTYDDVNPRWRQEYLAILREQHAKGASISTAMYAANAGMDRGDRYAWDNNCQRVVFAAELRARGYDVTAPPYMKKADNYTDVFLHQLRTRDGSPLNEHIHKGGKREFERFAKQCPAGSRFFVMKTGHVTSAHVEEDAQGRKHVAYCEYQCPGDDMDGYRRLAREAGYSEEECQGSLGFRIRRQKFREWVRVDDLDVDDTLLRGDPRTGGAPFVRPAHDDVMTVKPTGTVSESTRIQYWRESNERSGR